MGGDGNDTLRGGEGSDHLRGEQGNDKLYGGLGPDFFYFGNNGGVDQIFDFDGKDVIVISVDRYDSFADLDIVQQGLNTVIDFGGGNKIVLVATLASTLAAADFQFL